MVQVHTSTGGGVNIILERRESTWEHKNPRALNHDEYLAAKAQLEAAFPDDLPRARRLLRRIWARGRAP